MKSFKEHLTEVSADTDIVSIAHKREYLQAHDKLRDISSAAGRIRGKDPQSIMRKKSLKQKALNYRLKAKRHLDTIRKIRKDYKERRKKV